MVSAVASDTVPKVDTCKSSIVRLPLDSQSSGQLEYKEIGFLDIICPAVDSTKNLQEIPCLKHPQTINRRSCTCVKGNVLEKLVSIDKGSQVASVNRLLLFSLESSEEPKNIGVKDFELLKVVGHGAFGKVFQVKGKGTLEIYAMKVMSKDKIMRRKQDAYIKAERDILTKIVHPFIVQLRYSFPDPGAISCLSDCSFTTI